MIIFAHVDYDDRMGHNLDRVRGKMTSQDLTLTIAAFAVEEQVLMTELSRSIEQKETIAAGLLLCLSFLVGQTINDLKIERLDRIYPIKRNQGLIDFKLVCRQLPSQMEICLGVCVLTSLDLPVVRDAYNSLLVYKDFGLDRLCILRPGDLMTNVTQLPNYLPKLLSSDIGGNFIPIKSIDLLSIFTTLSVFRHKQQHGINREMISDYLHQKELLTKNELVKNILATIEL